jgi:RNA exonuclease 4
MGKRQRGGFTKAPKSTGSTATGSNWKRMLAKQPPRDPAAPPRPPPRKRVRRKDKKAAGADGAAAAAEFPKHDLMAPLTTLPFHRGEYAADALPAAVALDCEMVGVGPGGERSALARTCVIDETGAVLYDKYCRPKEKVVDFRTKWSGVVPADLRGAMPLEKMAREVAALLKGKLLVGHALQNDLSALFLNHPKEMIRDTALYKPLQREVGATVRKGRHRGGGGAGKRRPRALRHLATEHLGYTIQDHGDAGHSPAEDARAALHLYRKFRLNWESALHSKKRGREGRGKKMAVQRVGGAHQSSIKPGRRRRGGTWKEGQRGFGDEGG